MINKDLHSCTTEPLRGNGDGENVGDHGRFQCFCILVRNFAFVCESAEIFLRKNANFLEEKQHFCKRKTSFSVISPPIFTITMSLQGLCKVNIHRKTVWHCVNQYVEVEIANTSIFMYSVSTEIL